MPRTITFHPLSLALGLALGAACLLSMAQTSVLKVIRVEYLPDPHSLVQFQSGTPYVVPASKRFVLTALGTPVLYSAPPIVSFFANGQAVAEVQSESLGSGSRSIVPVPGGYSAPAGTTLTVGAAGSSASCSAWGYLVAQ